MPTRTFRLSIRQVVVRVWLALAGLMLTIPVVYGQTPNWSQPIPLSSPELSSWWPDVTADGTGRVHVVWSSTTGTMDEEGHRKTGHDVVMYATSPEGQVWSEPIDIAAMPQTRGSEATRPGVLTDGQGVLHLNFRYTDVFYTRAPAGSVATDIPQLVPRRVSTAGIAYFSRMALDQQGRLHLVLTQMVPDPENEDCPDCYHVFYRRSDDSGLSWSTPTDISILPTGAAKPQMVIDGQNYIHVVWEAGRGGAYGGVAEPSGAMYAASYDGGKTWMPPIQFIAPGGKAANIALGLDGQSSLMVVWLGLSEDAVYYQFSRDHGRSWSPPQPIPGALGGISVYGTPLDDYAMATDSAGGIHLVLVGRTAADQKSLSVLHLTWDGSTWSKPEAITTLMEDVPEWPRIAIGLGNQLHAVWFVRDQEHVWDTEDGKYRIWYARGSSSAPAITPIVWPTATPTPKAEVITTPTPIPMPTLSPTPTPTLDPGLVQVSIPPGTTDSIYTDTDELMLLAKSLIPAILVIVVVVVGVRAWRR